MFFAGSTSIPFHAHRQHINKRFLHPWKDQPRLWTDHFRSFTKIKHSIIYMAVIENVTISPTDMVKKANNPDNRFAICRANFTTSHPHHMLISLVVENLWRGQPSSPKGVLVNSTMIFLGDRFSRIYNTHKSRKAIKTIHPMFFIIHLNDSQNFLINLVLYRRSLFQEEVCQHTYNHPKARNLVTIHEDVIGHYFR